MAHSTLETALADVEKQCRERTVVVVWRKDYERWAEQIGALVKARGFRLFDAPVWTTKNQAWLAEK